MMKQNSQYKSNSIFYNAGCLSFLYKGGGNQSGPVRQVFLVTSRIAWRICLFIG